jgi:microcystin-dependent protein
MAIGPVGLAPGNGFVPPVGLIWTSGSSTSPASYFSGTSWTRMTDRFLIGAGGSYSLGSIGGATSHILTVAEMPAHSHSGSISAVGDHNHTIYDAGGTSIQAESSWIGAGERNFSTTTASFGTSGSHSHSVSIGYTGSGWAFSIMNPYIGKYMWRRVS